MCYLMAFDCRLVIGKVVGGKAATAAEPGAVSVVPYGEQSAFMAGWKVISDDVPKESCNFLLGRQALR